MTGIELTQQTAAFRLTVKKRSDKLINLFLVSYFLIGLILASYYDTWLVALGSGGLCLLAYYSVKVAMPASNLYQYVLSVVLGVFMAQYIYQMHGLFEMHFFAFIGSAILITYQNWKLQIPMLLVVIIHHVAFGYLQNSGIANIYFTQLDSIEWQTFLIRFVLAGIIFFVCGLWAYQLKKSSETQIAQIMEMSKLQKEAQLAQELATVKASLEKEKYYLDSLMDNMPNCIYFKDKESRLLRVSKYMSDRYDCSLTELIGKTDFDFQNEAHARQAYEDEQTILHTGNPKIDYVEKEIGKDGGEFWVTTTKLPLRNSQGEIVGTFGISRDITKIKMLEEQRHAAELDSAVAEGKFEIASGVMHDIGNAIVGFVSHLHRIRRVSDTSNAANIQKLVEFITTQKTSLATVIGETKTDAVIKLLCGIALTERSNQEEINKSIAEQNNIIAHIQEILQIQRQYVTGRETQERKPVNLRDIINDCTSMLFGSIEKMGIELQINIPEKLPIIKGDRTKLMQVALNLFKNSMEAIAADQTSKSISIHVHMAGNQLIMEIKDNGHGFDQATAAQLFTRGFTTKPSGTGLGLYNCRGILASHKATIDLKSEGLGKGVVTTIHFTVQE